MDKLESILRAEEDARQALGDAQSRAAGILAQATAEADLVRREAQRQAAEEAARLREDALADARADAARIGEKDATAVDELRAAGEKALPEAIAAAVRELVG
ncbi:MAG: hypothetical protein C0418_00280 [Coriobacteriaceae bacterium]|nr:hypothetical protein [Coriobacteriaceae bacterium]